MRMRSTLSLCAGDSRLFLSSKLWALKLLCVCGGGVCVCDLCVCACVGACVPLNSR